MRPFLSLPHSLLVFFSLQFFPFLSTTFFVWHTQYTHLYTYQSVFYVNHYIMYCFPNGKIHSPPPFISSQCDYVADSKISCSFDLLWPQTVRWPDLWFDLAFAAYPPPPGVVTSNFNRSWSSVERGLLIERAWAIRENSFMGFSREASVGVRMTPFRCRSGRDFLRYFLFLFGNFLSQFFFKKYVYCTCIIFCKLQN